LGNSRVRPRCRVEACGDLIEPILEQVPVQIERHCRGLVPEHLLHDLDVRAGGDRQRSGGVTKAVRHEAVESDCTRRSRRGYWTI
jgi:hypothetical protein